MDNMNSGSADSLARLPQRVGNLLELLTTLDVKLLNALDALENMQRSVSSFEPVSSRADVFIEDVQGRIEAFDERLNRDLDEIKAAILAKLDGLELDGFGPRLDRLEEAILNIERATMDLDQAFEGGLEMLPDFMTRRIRGEGKKEAPDPALDGPTRQE